MTPMSGTNIIAQMFTSLKSNRRFEPRPECHSKVADSAYLINATTT